jgi:hypothetical protein
MKKTKNWVFSTIKIIIAIFSFLILCNFIVDPLQHYRKASFYKPFYKNSRYLNPGIAKTHDYNAVIIGTSMVQNFRPTYVDKVCGVNSVKLPLPGSSAYEQGLILDTALRTGKVRRVYFGLDVFAFKGPVTWESNGKGSMPLYLYDDDVFNDLEYLLSIDTVRFYKFILRANIFGIDEEKLEHDNYGYWGNKFDFSREEVLKDWRSATFNKSSPREDFDFLNLKNNFDANLQKHFQAYPDVKFDIFFPPYSILVWIDSKQKGIVEEILKFKKYVIESTAEEKNIRVFDFQTIETIVLNLDNYKDVSHYSPSINEFMIDSISAGRFLTDKQTSNRQQIELSNMIDAHVASYPR